MITILPNDLLKRIIARIIVDEWDHHVGVNRRERTRISLVCKLWLRLRRELVSASVRCIEDPEVAEFYRLENWRTRNRWYSTSLAHTAIFPDYERLYLAADDVAGGIDAFEEWPPSARDRRYKKRCIQQRTRCHLFADKAEETLEFLNKYEEEFEKRVFEAALRARLDTFLGPAAKTAMALKGRSISELYAHFKKMKIDTALALMDIIEDVYMQLAAQRRGRRICRRGARHDRRRDPGARQGRAICSGSV